jgi:hypothetical protein
MSRACTDALGGWLRVHSEINVLQGRVRGEGGCSVLSQAPLTQVNAGPLGNGYSLLRL